MPTPAFYVISQRRRHLKRRNCRDSVLGNHVRRHFVRDSACELTLRPSFQRTKCSVDFIDLTRARQLVYDESRPSLVIPTGWHGNHSASRTHPGVRATFFARRREDLVRIAAGMHAGHPRPAFRTSVNGRGARRTRKRRRGINAHRSIPFCTLLVNDDHGKTWQRDVELEQARRDSNIVPVDSPGLCQLEDGKILVVLQAIDRTKKDEPWYGFHTGMSVIGNIIEPAE